jgi:Protein of unknown function (DUF3048) N-terminal domain/Protein of unknown function (DUF3048) C-terminal domain
MRRSLIALLAATVGALAVLVASQLGTLGLGGADAATSSPAAASAVASPPPAGTAAPPTLPPATPGPTPMPTPAMIPAPLTGLPVTPEVAARQPIAVMIDDHPNARPQSGFNAASVVWHAPAEAGIPRYMLVFQDEIPKSVGPIRSARQYYVEWAAEWEALYVHAGGSPQAIRTLRKKGQGEWVYDADEFRWGGSYLWRTTDRFAPHNVYTDGKHLRDLADVLGAADEVLQPRWSFGPAVPAAERPKGGVIRVVYPFETVTYRYDRESNRYVRYVCPLVCAAARPRADPQVDVADGKVVAPSNVVILRMAFGPLNDGHPEKYRLEARNVGTGVAWISSNGRTVKGTWSKASPKAPTLLFGADGTPVILTAGQTFVQVIPLDYTFDIRDGAGLAASPGPQPD